MKDKAIIDFFQQNLKDPISDANVVSIDDGHVRLGDQEYPIVNGAPVIFHERESLFSVADVQNDAKTTQNSNYRDRRIFRNFVRQSLPKLAHDFREEERFDWLRNLADKGPVLIIGSGDKGEFYREKFKDSLVVNSDVHNQFGVDIVFDGHNIPFKDETFQLVFTSQVLEHTVQPWMVAREISRVTKRGGYIHNEVPFCFPYHGQPYDFYRFTPGGLRLLFSMCEMVREEVISGGGAASAYMLSESMINRASGRVPRMVLLFLARLFFFWLKYTDFLTPKSARRRVVAAMNIAQTFKKDLRERSKKEMLSEIKLKFS